MKSTNSIIFPCTCVKFTKDLRADRVLKKKTSAWWKVFQPSNSNNSRTSHKSLDSRRSHTQQKKTTRNVAMWRRVFFPFHSRSMRHVTLLIRYIFYATYVFCFHFFFIPLAAVRHSFLTSVAQQAATHRRCVACSLIM